MQNMNPHFIPEQRQCFHTFLQVCQEHLLLSTTLSFPCPFHQFSWIVKVQHLQPPDIICITIAQKGQFIVSPHLCLKPLLRMLDLHHLPSKIYCGIDVLGFSRISYPSSSNKEVGRRTLRPLPHRKEKLLQTARHRANTA